MDGGGACEGPPVSKERRKCRLPKQQTLSRERMPLSKWMRPVIFPPLISDASAKWEVKSQIWDVTFALPPPACLLSNRPPYPPPSYPSTRCVPRVPVWLRITRWLNGFLRRSGGGRVPWVRAQGTEAHRESDKGVKIELGDKAERLARQWRQGVTSRGFNLSRLASLC